MWKWLLSLSVLVCFLDAGQAYGIAGQHAFERAERLRSRAETAAENGHPVIARRTLWRANRAQRRGYRRFRIHHFRAAKHY